VRSRYFSRISHFWKLVTIAALAAAALPTWAQYPSKPIHVVVTFLAGGSADTLARIVAPKLAEAWGQPVIVENRAGAAGNLGADFVAKAPPDGYTVMFTPPSPLGINWLLYKQMPFDPRTAFTPVSVLGAMPNILIVGPRVLSKDIGEFIAYAKAQPGKLNYGSQGVGSTPHLTGAMLALAAGIDIVHVPYKGFPPILTDLMGSRLDFAFLDSSNALPRLKDGRVRALAVASEKRFFALPDTPTLVEAGFPTMVSLTWMSFAGPAGMPVEIARKWHEELQRIVKMPDVQARFANLGFEAWASSPEEMRQQMESEMVHWGEVIKRTGAQSD
jgi:tripartite-type tricarboxylate transporter receptor subunit TctC